MIRVINVLTAAVLIASISQPLPAMAKGKSGKANISEINVTKTQDSSSNQLMRKNDGSGSKVKGGYNLKQNKPF